MEKGRSSNLKKHCDEVHGGKQVQLKCKVVRAFQDPLTRQLEEAQRKRCEPRSLLNDKKKWTRQVGCSLFKHRM